MSAPSHSDPQITVSPSRGQQEYRRPSEAWLAKPAWTDGGVFPPRYYYTQEDIDDELLRAGIDPATRVPLTGSRAHVTLMPEIVPSLQPVPPTLPIPSSPAVQQTSPHYRTYDSANPDVLPHVCEYTVTVTTLSFPPDVPRTKSAAPKKQPLTKIGSVVLDGPISRVDFIKNVLDIHELGQAFAPGVHSGPDFKLWWTGSLGGKSGAASIQNDKDFKVAITAILAKKTKVQVSVQLDLELMAAYRIKQILPACAIENENSGNDELAYGTRVPKVDDFSDITQLHGRAILELKKRWPCQLHTGEHGEKAYCYVSLTGEHLMLNPLQFKAWAAAIVAAEAMKNVPPNTLVFDGARDGTLPGPKPRGRSGPGPRGHLEVVTPSSSTDGAVQLLSIFAPILESLVRTPRRKRRHSDSDIGSSPPRPRASKRIKEVLSPLPEKGQELRQCLVDFYNETGIDLRLREEALVADDYTPDIVSHIGDAILGKRLEATHGVVIKFKIFCENWSSRWNQKRHASISG